MDTQNTVSEEGFAGERIQMPAARGEAGQEIDDPWYTRDFRGALAQIEAGCRGLMQHLRNGWTGASG